MTVDSYGGTLANFASLTLSARVGLDRLVVDNTALSGMFEIHLEFAPPSGASDSAAPAIFTAIQDQLGLRLSAATGPAEVLVMEQIEKPSDN